MVPTREGEARDLRVPSQMQPEDQSAQLFGGWGPDGQTVFVRKISTNKTKEAELWLVPVNGGSPKKLVGDVAVTGLMGAGPDGRHFVYTVPEVR